MQNWMIGLLTRMREASSPFHNDNSPSDLTNYFPAFRSELFVSACLVLSTQKGLVAIDAIHPAAPDDFIMLDSELGLNLNISLALAYDTKYIA